MDIRAYNREAWDREVEAGNEWTIPVSSEVVAAARQGQWQILLTPIKPVPSAWFPELVGQATLCLASGGGQQAPLLAAAGAQITVLDNSPRQLAQDRLVAQRDGLEIATIEGDMRDLSMFSDESFGLIIHPVSNLFVPDIHPVWREAYRVLRRGGVMLAGFNNPVIYIFDLDEAEKGIFEVKHSLPYSDLESLSAQDLQRIQQLGWPLEFSHTLEDQIGGQIDAGFTITGFYEDRQPGHPLAGVMPLFAATRAVKPS